MKGHLAKTAGQYKSAACGINTFHKSGPLYTPEQFKQEMSDEKRHKFLCSKCVAKIQAEEPEEAPLASVTVDSSDVRTSEEYKSMTPYLATGLAEGFEEADSEEQVVAAWQYLHDTKLAYQLQGWFGRTATHLIEQGIIEA